ERDPGNEHAADARQKLAVIEPVVNGIMAEANVHGEEGMEFLALHEEVQSLLAQCRYSKAREVAAKLLQRNPQFAPALNNTAEAWFRDGRLEEAIAAEQR